MKLFSLILLLFWTCSGLCQENKSSVKATVHISSTKKYLIQSSKTSIDLKTWNKFFHNDTIVSYDDETVTKIRDILLSTASRRGEPIYSSSNDSVVLEFFEPLDATYQSPTGIRADIELGKKYLNGAIVTPFKEFLKYVGIDASYQELIYVKLQELVSFTQSPFDMAYSYICEKMGEMFVDMDDRIFNSDEEFVLILDDDTVWNILVIVERPCGLTRDELTERTSAAFYEFLSKSSSIPTCMNLVDGNGHFRATVKLIELNESSNTFKATVCDSDWKNFEQLKISFE